MLNIVTWIWGSKYTPAYVRRLANGVRKHLKQPHRFIVIADRLSFPDYECHDIKDRALLGVKGCFARLRMFDPQWQNELRLTGRIVCLDLDTVITGELDPLFDRVEPFVILQGANAANPCPYTACIFMLRIGAHPELWTEFSLTAAQTIPQYEFPDDQGWLWHRAPAAAAWHVGHRSGIYAFHKPGWPRGTDNLPTDARMVAFIGSRDPSHFTHLQWVNEHWQ